MRLFQFASSVLITGFLALSVGCFETKTPLASMDTGKVDPAFCGDWDLGADSTGTHRGTMVVRNLNDKHYYVEIAKPGEEAMRMLGFTVDVKGVAIAHLRGLEPTGKYSDGWLLVRIGMADGKFTFRQLNDEFFKEKPHDTAEALRKLIEGNLENDAMYDEEKFTATRLEK